MANGLCSSCVFAIWCPTWAEMRCSAKSKRIYGWKTLNKCEFYKKRDKGFKEPKCQCENCLENDLLWDEECEEEE